MVLTWERNAPGRLRDAIEKELDQNRDPGALAALLDSAKQSNGSLPYELKWMELPAGASHPQKIAKDKVEKSLAVDLVVSQQERQE